MLPAGWGLFLTLPGDGHRAVPHLRDVRDDRDDGAGVVGVLGELLQPGDPGDGVVGVTRRGVEDEEVGPGVAACQRDGEADPLLAGEFLVPEVVEVLEVVVGEPLPGMRSAQEGVRLVGEHLRDVVTDPHVGLDLVDLRAVDELGCSAQGGAGVVAAPAHGPAAGLHPTGEDQAQAGPGQLARGLDEDELAGRDAEARRVEERGVPPVGGESVDGQHGRDRSRPGAGRRRRGRVTASVYLD